MNAFSIFSQLCLQQWQIALEAPLVIQQRLWRFSQPLWSEQTMEEYQHMYWEKVSAAQALCGTWYLFYASPRQQKRLLDIRRPYRYQQWVSDSVCTANRALHPISRRVHANCARLGKTSLFAA